MSHRFRLPKDRIAALATDWGLLIVLSYCVYFLINHWYRATHHVSAVYRVPFPDYAYVLTLVATFLLALAWENLGTSIGWKGVGLAQGDKNHRRLGFSRRALHLVADLTSWAATVLGGTLAALPVAGLGVLLYGIASRTGITILPTVTFWPIGSWYVTLGLTLGLVAALVIVGAVSWWMARAIWRWLWPGRKGDLAWCDRAVGSQACRNADLELGGPPRRWWQTSWGLMTLLIVCVAVYVGTLTTEVNIGTMIQRVSSTGYYWNQLIHPDFTHFFNPDPNLASDPRLAATMLDATIETIFMALMATLLGVVLAFPLSFLGARNMMTKNRLGWSVYTLMRGFFNIGRSIEPFIMAVVIATCLGYGVFAGTLALFVHTVAALGKLYSEQIEAIDPGPVEAIVASGGRRLQILRFGVIPQVVPPFLAFTLYRWDINVRMATIVGMVGGGGIGRFLNYYKNELLWREVGAIIIIITVVVWTLDYVSGRVRERIS